MGLFISGMLVQVRAVPKRRSTHQTIKVTNMNHMNMMKTSMTEIPVCLRERFSSYKTLFRLVPCYKRDWGTLLHRCYYLLLVTFHLLPLTSLHHHLLPLLSVLAVITLLKTVYHSLLLLVGFDTLIYQKGLRLIPYTCGSSRLFSGAVAGERSAFGKWNLVRKHLHTVLKFIVTCHYGNCSFEEFVRGIFTRNGGTRICSST